MKASRSFSILHDIEMAISILMLGQPGLLVREIKRRMYSEDTFYGLRRDLLLPFDPPRAKIPIRIRPLEEDDVPKLLTRREIELHQTDAKDYLRRISLIRSGIPTCYVAATADDDPCYMQWLIGPQENEAILRHFRGGFPPLGPDEMLLEGAYTPMRYRGLGIMSCAMAHISEKGGELGARRLITFVSNDNDPALKGCKHAGFLPFTIRTAQWRTFKRRLNFVPLSPVPGGNVVKIPRVFRSGQ